MDRVEKKERVPLKVRLEAFLKKRRSADEIQDLTVALSLCSLFIGAWITFHIGVSFLLCGGLVLAFAVFLPFRG